MQTNLIQNFVHKIYTPPSEQKAPDFDIHHELKNKNFVKPLQSSGYLVKNNIFDAPAIMAKSFAYDLKSLKRGINGNADDHQLGKVNDIGMKLGGLAIAGYLYTKRQSPMTKAMEFIGLGTFFASMALWPKLAIQLPAQLIHGFNVQQQYIDSFGRKKPFFQDPQFLAWDSYKDEEINKIGDWMGVPRNIPNRREFIQQKMQKIAIQNNTLWMLTAGFATPVMSALMCNVLEKPVRQFLGNINNKTNNKQIKNLNELAKNLQNNQIKKKVNNVLSINQNKVLTDELLEELGSAITYGFEPQIKETAIKDLRKLLEADHFMINENTINAIVDNTEKVLIDAGFDKETARRLLPSYEELLQSFDRESGCFQTARSDNDLNKVFTIYYDKLNEKINNYNETALKNPDSGFKALTQREIRKINKLIIAPQTDENPVMLGLKKERYATLNHNNQKMINSLAEAFNSLRAKLDAAENFTLRQLGNAPETTMANYWNETLDTFIKGLNLSSQQIKNIKNDRLVATNFLKTAFDDIASDKKRYKDFMTSFIEKFAQIEKLIKPSDTREIMYSNAETSKLDAFLDKSFKEFQTEISALPGYKPSFMESTLNSLIGIGGHNFENRNAQGSFKQHYKELAYERIAEVKSSFFRIINTLDLHRRLAYGDPQYFLALHSSMPREMKEEIVELSKTTGIAGHTADFLTKFYKRINPNMDELDLSSIQIKNGKLIYKYINRPVSPRRVDMPEDSRLFIESMRLSYQNSILPETEKVFGQHKGLLEEYKKYRAMVFHDIGNKRYFENIFRNVSHDVSTASDNKIFIETGAATDELLYNYCNRAFNTNKWLRTFTTVGAALLGVTVLSQFFFGRMKTPKTIETQKEQTYA